MSPAASKAAAQPAGPAERVVARVRRERRVLILTDVVVLTTWRFGQDANVSLTQKWLAIAVYC